MIKELLIKIKALFEGSGMEDAASGADALADSSENAAAGLEKLDDAAAQTAAATESLADSGEDAGTGLEKLEGAAEEAADATDSLAKNNTDAAASASSLADAVDSAAAGAGRLGTESGNAADNVGKMAVSTADAAQKSSGLGASAESSGGGLARLRAMMKECAAGAGAFAGGITALGASLISFGGSVVMGGVQALAGLVGGFFDGIKMAAAFSAEIGRTAKQTGESVASITLLRQAFRAAGLSGNEVGRAVEQLRTAISEAANSTTPAAAAFAKLGMDIGELSRQDAAAGMEAVAVAIAGIEDPATRAQVATDLFGAAGQKLLAVLADVGVFETARQQIGRLGEILGANADSMAKFSNAINEGLDVKKMGFFAGLASGLAGDMDSATKAINNFQAEKMGVIVSAIARDISNSVQSLYNATHFFSDLVNKIPILGSINKFYEDNFTWIGRLRSAYNGWITEADAQIDMMNLKAASTSTATVESAAQTMYRIAEESGRNALITGQQATARVDASGEAASASIAETGAHAAEQVQLTGEQLRQATDQIKAEMAKAISGDISPAISALTSGVQESLARITGEITSQSTTINSSITQLGSAMVTAQQVQARGLAAVAAQLAAAVASLQNQINVLAAR